MTRKKVDNRIRILIENGVRLGHRTMFAIVGSKAKDQVVILHHMLSKEEVKARPSVLWCYKSNLAFSSHRKKKMRKLQKKAQSGTIEVNEDDSFELFIASTNIRYSYYSETHKILGNTYGMCVLQDFEALTPNLLARTIETVEGGGIIAVLLESVNSLNQLYSMTMDVHSRYRTEFHKNVVGRFNERFILSLGSCEDCLVMDDELNVLPISSHYENITRVAATAGQKTPEEIELDSLKESLEDTQPVGAIINCCKTLDQGKAVLKFIDSISEKSLTATVSLTASRGRGKSAALGLAMAAAIGFGYSNVYVTSPSPENLQTLFEFLLKGLDALNYQEHIDYDVVRSTEKDCKKIVLRINVFRDHRQTIQYISPTDYQKLGQAELVVIDEAAAIPLPIVEKLFGPYLIFMASTINGYEGTGRSLSLKLIKRLRTHGSVGKSSTTATVTGRTLEEISLVESIRYKPGDKIEQWLTNLLCLDCTLEPPTTPKPIAKEDCELFYINRDTLFSFHKASEAFLHKIMSLYVASHYKNSPNDLQLMSDAPGHHLFCLAGPTDPSKKSLPDVLCVIQVCLEGKISGSSIREGLQAGNKASGDLIPWNIAQQFQDENFPSMLGARIVRIAAHPDYLSMGYGSKAIDLLVKYYEGKMIDLEESSKMDQDMEIDRNADNQDIIGPRKNLPPLLLKLTERTPEELGYIGVSYGITHQLFKFWKRCGFVPLYLRQTSNELTGEHTCIMLKEINQGGKDVCSENWLMNYYQDFRRRLCSLFSFQFRNFGLYLAAGLMENKNVGTLPVRELTYEELSMFVTPHDLKRMEKFTKNMVDYHFIMDLIPIFARLYFLNQMGESCKVSAVQAATLLGLGLQHRTVDDIAQDLDTPGSQLLGLFNRTVRKIYKFMNRLHEEQMAKKLHLDSEKETFEGLEPVGESLHDELEEGAKVIAKQQSEYKRKLHEHLGNDMSQFAIRGTDKQWKEATKSASDSISIKVGEKRIGENAPTNGADNPKKSKKSSNDFGKGWKKPKGGKHKKN